MNIFVYLLNDKHYMKLLVSAKSVAETKFRCSVESNVSAANYISADPPVTPLLPADGYLIISSRKLRPNLYCPIIDGLHQ